jgi:hypothetical protein
MFVWRYAIWQPCFQGRGNPLCVRDFFQWMDGGFMITFSIRRHVLSQARRQCDQIGRNFAFLGKKFLLFAKGFKFIVSNIQ